MRRADLEHVIRASAVIAADEEIIVVGSQAILGQYPNAPTELLVSVEADVYPKNHPDRWELIDGSIGELSPFHDTFGYYAQGVEPGTAILPAGWEGRLIPISNAQTCGAKGLCLEVHDLAISKLVALRDKDKAFVRALVNHRLVQRQMLEARLGATELEPARRELAANLLAEMFGGRQD